MTAVLILDAAAIFLAIVALVLSMRSIRLNRSAENQRMRSTEANNDAAFWREQAEFWREQEKLLRELDGDSRKSVGSIFPEAVVPADRAVFLVADHRSKTGDAP